MATYKETVLADTPLLYYRIDDAGSEIEGEAKDEGSLKLNGKYHGTVPLAEGALVPSGDLDKAGSWSNNLANYIGVPANAGLELATTFTIEAWIFPTTAEQSGGIYSFSQGGTVNSSSELYLDKGSAPRSLHFRIVKTGLQTLEINNVIVANTYSYVVATYDNTNMRLYLNAVEIAKLAVAGPATVGVGEGFVGKLPEAFYPFNGRIDEVAIYGTTLSPARISAHYVAGTQAPLSPFTESGAMPRAGHKHPAIRVGALA